MDMGNMGMDMGEHFSNMGMDMGMGAGTTGMGEHGEHVGGYKTHGY